MTLSAPFFIRIPSSLDEVDQVHAGMMHFLAKTDYSSALKSRVELAVVEALTNAIRHGNLHDPKKQVEVEIRQKDTGLICVVSDQGSGFNVDEVPDPLNSENLLNTGGRGVFLIREMADEVSYEDSGRKVQMVFRE